MRSKTGLYFGWTYLLAAGLLTLVLAPVYAGSDIWVPLGPNGSTVETVTGNSTGLYIGVWQQGVFRSLDEGVTWLHSSDGLTDTMISTLAAGSFSSTVVLFAGTYNGNVFKSVDGGEHWHILPGCSRFMDGNPLLEIVLDPTNPNTVYLRRYVMMVYKSEDGGTTCHDIGPNWPNLFTRALVVDPVTPTILYLGTNQGVLKSMDGGNTWEARNSGLGDSVVHAIALAPSAPNILYAGTLHGVYRSDDGAEHWQETGLTCDIRELAVDPTNVNLIYAATFEPGDHQPNLLRTEDGGTSWHPAGTGWGNPSINSIFVHPFSPTRVYVGTDGKGVFRRSEAISTVFLPIVLR